MNPHPLISALETATPHTTTLYGAIPLPIDDAARIAALAEMYPQHSYESLITALLHHALGHISAETQPHE